MASRSSGAHFKRPDDAAGAPRAARHTRDSLEGATATPLESVSAEDLRSGASRLDPTVRRQERRPGQLEALLQDDLEPQTSASRRASGTATLISSTDGPDGPSHGGPGGPSHGGHDHGRKRRRVPLPVKVLLVLLALILVVCAAIAVWAANLQSSMSLAEEDRAELQDSLVAPETQDEAFYTLIIGSDAREGDTVSRADVVMLARVDTSNAKITLISIPRDTMISTGDSVQKINAFYNYGAASQVDAVSQFAGVDIAHYVQVDFEGVKEVVDALGGVTVNIPENITAGNGGLSLSAGEQTLNGEQALAYARERYNVSGGDFGRAQAQRQIVTAIVKEVLASGPTEMPFLISQLAGSISTDLSVPDIIGYALHISQAGEPLTIYSAITPSYSYNVGGVSYVATMYDEWRAIMQRADAGLDPNDESAQIPEEQAQDETLGAATNGGGPRDYRELADNSSFTTDLVATVDE